MSLDELWVQRKGGAPSWRDALSDEAQAWLDQIADRIIELGKEPIWGSVLTVLERDFPDDVVPTDTTLARTIRQMVKARLKARSK